MTQTPLRRWTWLPEAGVYNFRILDCQATHFSTGSEGIRLQLEVEAGGPGPLKIVSRIVFGERSTWMMRELCECVRVCFDPPCEAADLVGKSGRARFEVDEQRGLITLSVHRYLAPLA